MQSWQLLPLTFPFSPLSFSALVLLLFRGMIWSVITSDGLPPLSSATSMPRRVLPMAEEGFFPGLGPWPNVDVDMDLFGLLPPIITPQNPAVRLLGRRGGFWWRRAYVMACQILPSINARVSSLA